MKLIQKYIRKLVSETRLKQLAKSKYRNLDSYLSQADFMTLDAGNGDYEFDENGHRYFTEASDQLRNDLNDYFDQNMGNVVVSAIIHADEGIPTEKVGEIAKAANYHFADGMHNVELTVAELENGKTYQEEFGSKGASKLAQVLRHELLHMNQFLQFSKGNPTDELYDEFSKEYSTAKKQNWKDGAYHTFDIGFSELEAFAHQIADELVSELGFNDAMKILNQRDTIPAKELEQHSDSWNDVTKKLDNYNSPEIKDMLTRARQYAIKIGK